MAELSLTRSPDAAPHCEVAAVAADAETLGFLRSYLAETVAGGVHLEKGGLGQLISYLERAETPPRLVLVDLSGLETPLTEMDRLAEVCEPSVTVIAIGEQENVHLFRELLRLGVSDYILKPLSADLLEPYVRERRPGIVVSGGHARRGRIIAVAGGRGGVGTTTLAVALAWRLANVQKRRVALVDLDLHGGAACVQLGLQPGGLLEALDNPTKIDSLFLDRTLIRHGQRLMVLAEEAPLRRDVTVTTLALDTLLDTLADDFHYIVVDVPRGLGSAMAHVLRKARTRIFVLDRTLPSLRDGTRLLELTRDLAGHSLVVVNDHHPGLTQIIGGEVIEKALGQPVGLAIDYDRGAAQKGDNFGDALGEGAGPLAAAADRLVALISGHRMPPARRRLFGLFGGRR